MNCNHPRKDVVIQSSGMIGDVEGGIYSGYVDELVCTVCGATLNDMSEAETEVQRVTRELSAWLDKLRCIFWTWLLYAPMWQIMTALWLIIAAIVVLIGLIIQIVSGG